MPEGVVDEVRQDPVEQPGVGQDGRQGVRDVDVDPLATREAGQGPGDDLVQADQDRPDR